MKGAAHGSTRAAVHVRERKRFERHDIWERIAENGTISAAVMVFAAIAAVICANTDAYEAIPSTFWRPRWYVGLGNLTAGLTVELFRQRLSHGDFLFVGGY